jgi:LysR family transcriptional regulator, benzoate and cis,cis-muconate-responsive activator of ben and cat genes
MEIRHLRYFVAVADELSFTRAAARLHIAQPPLSRQIRQLEEELGVQLFERSTRSISLTPAGSYLYQQARLIVARVRDVEDSVRRIAKGGRSWFGLGFVPSLLYGFLPELIRRLRETHPRVELGLNQLTTAQQVDALKTGRIDAGFGRIFIEDDAIVREIVDEEPLIAAVPAKNPISRRETTTLRRMSSLPYILYPARTRPSYADYILSLFRAHHLDVKVVQETDELQTALGLIAAGLGVTIIPESVRRHDRDEITYLRLENPKLISPIILSYRKNDDSPLLRRLRALVHETLRSNSRNRIPGLLI